MNLGPQRIIKANGIPKATAIMLLAFEPAISGLCFIYSCRLPASAACSYMFVSSRRSFIM